MKKLNFKKIKLLAAVISLPLIFNLVACDKKDGTSAAPPVGYAPGVIGGYGGGCANCFPNPQVLLPAVKASTGFDEAQFRLDLLAPQNPMTNLQDPKAPVFYSGPVAAQGILSIRTQDFSFCYAPVGDYQINTQNIGMMTAGVVSGLKINAVGPNGTQIMMTVATSSLYNPNGVNRYDIEGNRIGMTLRLDWVNGRACGILQTY